MRSAALLLASKSGEMKSPLRLFRSRERSDLTGHTLTGLYVEDSRLHLRLTDRVATVDLETGGVTLNRRRMKGKDELSLGSSSWLAADHGRRAAPRCLLPERIRRIVFVPDPHQERRGSVASDFQGRLCGSPDEPP